MFQLYAHLPGRSFSQCTPFLQNGCGDHLVTYHGVLPLDMIDTDDSTDAARFTSAYVISAINKVRNFAL